MGPRFKQFKTDVLDYPVRWSKWLAASDDSDTVASATFTVPANLTKGAVSNDATSCVVWLGPSTDADGTVYQITCQIVTTLGRTASTDFEVILIPRPTPGA